MGIRWPWQRSAEPSMPSARGRGDVSPEWPALAPLQRAVKAMRPTAPLGAFTASLTTSRNPSLVPPVQPVVDTGASLPIFAIAAPDVAHRVAQPPARTPHPQHRTFASIQRAKIGVAKHWADSTRQPDALAERDTQPEMTTAPILEEPLLVPIVDVPGGGGVPRGEVWTSPAETHNEQQPSRSDVPVGSQVVQSPIPVPMPVQRVRTDSPSPRTDPTVPASPTPIGHIAPPEHPPQTPVRRSATDTPPPHDEPTTPARPPLNHHTALPRLPSQTPVQRSATDTPRPRNEPTAPTPPTPSRLTAPPAAPPGHPPQPPVQRSATDTPPPRTETAVPEPPVFDRYPAPSDQVGVEMESEEVPSSVPVSPVVPVTSVSAASMSATSVARPGGVVTPEPIVPLTAPEANTVVATTSGPPGRFPVRNDSSQYTEPIAGVPAFEVVAARAPGPMNVPHPPVVTEENPPAQSDTPNASAAITSSEPPVPVQRQDTSVEPSWSNPLPVEKISPQPTRTSENSPGRSPVQRHSPHQFAMPSPGRSTTGSGRVEVGSSSPIPFPERAPGGIAAVEPSVAHTVRRESDHNSSDRSKQISAQRASIADESTTRVLSVASEPVSEPAAQRPPPGVRAPVHGTPLPVFRVTAVPAGIGAPM